MDFFHNFLVILNENHLVTDEIDDRDGSDSVSSEGQSVRDFE